MGKRQEQEEAQTEVTEVAPDVLRMQLPIQMPGLGHVNCYALVDGEGAAIVDPGLPGTASWRALQDRLKQAGIRPKHVHTVIVTHSHPDHFGGATKFVRESGARVIGHRNFRFGMPQATTPEVSAEHLGEKPVAAEGEAEPSHEESKAASSPGARALGQWGGPTPWGGTRPRPPFKQRMHWRMLRMFGGTDFRARDLRPGRERQTCCDWPSATGSCCTRQLSNVETKIVTRITILNVRKFVVLRLIIQSFQTFLTHLDSGQQRRALTRSGDDIIALLSRS